MRNKFLGMIFIFICIFSISYVFATDIATIVGGNAGITPQEVDGTFASNLIGALQWIGYAIAVGMLVFIGIKSCF